MRFFFFRLKKMTVVMKLRALKLGALECLSQRAALLTSWAIHIVYGAGLATMAVAAAVAAVAVITVGVIIVPTRSPPVSPVTSIVKPVTCIVKVLTQGISSPERSVATPVAAHTIFFLSVGVASAPLACIS
jgi:hypothetical protein